MGSSALQVSRPLDAATIEKVLIGGDLAKLTPQERVNYYGRVCESLGLNPLTRPFEYITLNGKLVLYAKRDAADQLRMKHKISVESVEHSQENELYIVTASGRDDKNRRDIGTGAVSIVYPDLRKDSQGNWVAHPKAGQMLKGEDLANAMMKAETKAKRRLTLSICGLGILDETEIDGHVDEQDVIATPEPIKPTTKKTVPQAESKPSPAQPVTGDVVYISEAALKRLFAIQGEAGMSDDILKKWLATKGVHSRKLIPIDLYNETIDYIDPEFAHHEKPENF